MKTSRYLLTPFLSLALSLLTPKVFCQNQNWQGPNARTNLETAKNYLKDNPNFVSSPQKVEIGPNGIFTLGLPLLTVPGRGGMDVPLVLQYTPGIKLTQEASWVGLGWEFNVGEISRNALGSQEDDDVYVRTVSPDIDPFRDVYSLSCPGGSGRLLQFPDGTNSCFRFEDWRAWKITYDVSTHRFIVISDDGTTYVFGGSNAEAYTSVGATSNIDFCNGDPRCHNGLMFPLNEPFLKWRLAAILSPNYEDAGGDPYDPLDFDGGADNRGNWVKFTYRYDSFDRAKWFFYSNWRDLNPPEREISLERISYPEYVITPLYVAKFETEPEVHNPISTYRTKEMPYFGYGLRNHDYLNWLLDSHPGGPGSMKRRLSTIRLYRNNFLHSGSPNVPSDLGSPLKVLSFSYYQDIDYSEYVEPRTMLKQISVAAGSLTLPAPYTFEYWNVRPSSHSGIAYDPTFFLYPDRRFVGRGGWYNSILVAEGDEWQSSFAQDGKQSNLSRIVYPTGASIEFDYESNRFHSNFKYDGILDPGAPLIWGNGCRVTKQTVNTTTASQTFLYEYGGFKMDGTEIQSAGRLYADPMEFYISHFDVRDRKFVINSTIHHQANHPVLYEKIAERQPNNSRIISFYSVAKLDENLGPNSTDVNTQFNRTTAKRGSLLRQDFIDASGLLVKSISAVPVETVKYHYVLDPEYPIPFYFSYYKSAETVQTTTYDQNGGNGIVETVTRSYSPSTGLIASEQKTNSDLTIRQTITTYSGDYQATGSTADPAVAGLAAMNVRNIVSSPVEQFTKENNNVAEATLFEYALMPDRPQLHKTSRLLAANPVSNFSPATIQQQSGNLVLIKDNRYHEVSSNTRYDVYNNVVESQDAYGIPTTTVWGYDNSKAVGVFRNCNREDALVSVFDDEDPSLWIGGAGNWLIEGGAFKQKDGTTIQSWDNPRVKQQQGAWLEDCIVEANVRFDNEGTYRIAAISRHANADNFTRFEIQKTASFVRIHAKKNGQSVVLAADRTFAENQWYHLRGEIRGNIARLYVDGELLVTLDDLAVGGYAGRAGLCTFATAVSFDNVRFYPPVCAVSSSAYDVTSLQLSSVMDENGKSRAFEYDSFDRLLTVRDNKGRMLTENSYPSNDLKTVNSTSHFSSSANLVKNSSFENLTPVVIGGFTYYTPEHWTFHNISAAEYYGGEGLHGASCCALWSSNPDATIAQNIGVLKAGITYTASVYVRDPYQFGGTARIELVSGTGVTLSSSETAASPVWKKLSTSLRLTNDETISIRLTQVESSALISFDYVTVDKCESGLVPSFVSVTTDEFGKPIHQALSSESGLITHDWIYDNMSRLSSERDALDRYTDLRYLTDPLSRVSRKGVRSTAWAIDSGHETKVDYFSNANGEAGFSSNTLYKIRNRDEDDRITSSFIDKFGKTVAIVTDSGGLNIVTRFQYSALGNLLSVTDPRNQTTYYQFNTLSLLTQKTSPDAGTQKYLYDLNGNLRFVMDQKQALAGKFTYRKYDSFNRMLEEGEYSGLSDFNETNASNRVFPSSGVALKVNTYDVQTFPGQRNLKARLAKVVSNRSGQVVDITHYSYDDFGRVEWLVHENAGFSSKKVSYWYDLQGNVTKKCVNDFGSPSYRLYTFYEYDQVGRLRKVLTHTLDQVAGRVKEAEYTYFADGTVKRLQLGNAQGMDYRYNERGWLAQINHQNLGGVFNGQPQDPGRDGFDSGLPVDRFGMVLGYNTQEHIGSPNPNGQNAEPQFNGNVSWEIHSIAGANTPSTLVGHTFGYDKSNRLRSADFGYWGSSSWLPSSAYDLPLMQYDECGNIKALQRYNNAGSPLNRFRYDYPSSNSRLLAVFDSVSSTNSSYTYDENGNVTSDSYRGITSVTYDVNNLPETIVKDGATVNYSYDANGNRVRKQTGATNESYVLGADGQTEAVYGANGKLLFFNVTNGKETIGKYTSSLPIAVELVTDQIAGEHEAEGEIVASVPVESGKDTELRSSGAIVMKSGFSVPLGTNFRAYIVPSSASRYYYLKDHLGSIRVTVDQSGNVKGYDDYDAWGMQTRSANFSLSNDKYKFTGKERDVESGYDYFGARYYDSRIGRWLSVDPLAEKYREWSPYAYTIDNPLKYVDPDGMEIKIGRWWERALSFFGIKTEYVRSVENQVTQLKKDDSSVKAMVESLEASDKVHTIVPVTNSNNGNSATPDDWSKVDNQKPTGSTIEFDPKNEKTVAGNKRNPRVGLSHELTHANDFDKGTLDQSTTSNGIPMYEVGAVNMENKVRAKTGDTKRTSYGGVPIPKTLLKEEIKND